MGPMGSFVNTPLSSCEKPNSKMRTQRIRVQARASVLSTEGIPCGRGVSLRQLMQMLPVIRLLASLR
jgi:hypothetical protein